MSWLFGISGNFSSEELSVMTSALPPRSNEYSSKNSFLAWGGMEENILFCKNEEGVRIFCGIGLIEKHDKLSILQLDEFEKCDLNKIASLNGHYLYVEYTGNKTTIRNDRLGLRDLYFYFNDNKFVFSSEINLLSKFLKSVEIDFDEFSSLWETGFQLSTRSIIKKMERLGPGGDLVFQNGRLSVDNAAFLPEFKNNIAYNEFEQALENVCGIELHPETNLSLGLSGGMDSRLLLALLQSERKGKFIVHSFGEARHPDVFVASKMCEEFGIELHSIDNEQFVNNPAELMSELIGLMTGTAPVIPVFQLLDFRNYLTVFKDAGLIFDGGFGEIFRRQYLNRLLLKGEKAVRRNDFDNIFPTIADFKANIFHHEIEERMHESLKKNLTEAIRKMPEIDRIGFDNWLDYFAVMYKLPNIYGPGQTILDSISKAIMPFAQYDLLNAGLNIHPKERRNGIMFKKIIGEKLPSIRKFPLIKGGIEYPFVLGSKGAAIWRLIMQKTGGKFTSNLKPLFFQNLKEYIYDSLLPVAVQYPFYDRTKITNLTDKFFNGDTAKIDQLEWFVTFEEWRKATGIS